MGVCAVCECIRGLARSNSLQSQARIINHPFHAHNVALHHPVVALAQILLTPKILMPPLVHYIV